MQLEYWTRDVAKHATSKESHRLNIDQVRFEHGRAVATDGRMLVCPEHPTEYVPLTITAAAIEKAWKHAGRKGSVRAEPDDGGVLVTATDADGVALVIHDPDVHEFPDWRKIVPHVRVDESIKASPVGFGVDLALLSRLHAVLAGVIAGPTRGQVPVTLVAPDPLGPVSVCIGSSCVVAVFMPMRDTTADERADYHKGKAQD